MFDMRLLLSFAAQFFGFFFTLFLLVPLFGAWLMAKGFDRAKIVGRSLRQCAQAYLYASSATFLLIIALDVYLYSRPDIQESLRLVLGAAFVGLQLVLVPLLLRAFSRRALLIQGGSILAANAAAFALLYLVFVV
jgi:RsiW-degrading membrane proteinase PrsW (M82 family)